MDFMGSERSILPFILILASLIAVSSAGRFEWLYNFKYSHRNCAPSIFLEMFASRSLAFSSTKSTCPIER